jgi:hypothetical protein
VAASVLFFVGRVLPNIHSIERATWDVQETTSVFLPAPGVASSAYCNYATAAFFRGCHRNVAAAPHFAAMQ